MNHDTSRRKPDTEQVDIGRIHDDGEDPEGPRAPDPLHGEDPRAKHRRIGIRRDRRDQRGGALPPAVWRLALRPAKAVGMTTQMNLGMSFRWIVGTVAVSWLVALGSLAGDAQAAPAPVVLGAAGSFAVIGGSTVTNTGLSTVNGDLGVSPGTAVTGFPPGTISGMLHAADPIADQAHADLATAYADAAGRTSAVSIPAELGGVTLTPGVYAYGTGLALTAGTTLTLDAQGNPAAVFILQAGSTLITGADTHVTLSGGAQACNVFWQVGSSATLGASSVLTGTILASTSISMGYGVTIDRRRQRPDRQRFYLRCRNRRVTHADPDHRDRRNQ